MKRLIIFASCLLMLGCSSSPSTERNEAIARKLFDAFNKHDWQTMASYYADSALFLDPSYGIQYVKKSRKETVAKYTEMQAMFPDIHDKVTGVYPSGDVVTVEFTSTGSIHDSIRFELPIISVLTFRDGFVVKDATYYDLEKP